MPITRVGDDNVIQSANPRQSAPFIRGNPRRGQVTLEYFILFTVVAVLSIRGIAALRNEDVGVRKTVQDFMTAAAKKIAHDDVEVTPPIDPTQCPPGTCRQPPLGGCGNEEACTPDRYVCLPGPLCRECPEGQCLQPPPGGCGNEEACRPDQYVCRECPQPPLPEGGNR